MTWSFLAAEDFEVFEQGGRCWGGLLSWFWHGLSPYCMVCITVCSPSVLVGCASSSCAFSWPSSLLAKCSYKTTWLRSFYRKCDFRFPAYPVEVKHARVCTHWIFDGLHNVPLHLFCPQSHSSFHQGVPFGRQWCRQGWHDALGAGLSTGGLWLQSSLPWIPGDV